MDGSNHDLNLKTPTEALIPATMKLRSIYDDVYPFSRDDRAVLAAA